MYNVQSSMDIYNSCYFLPRMDPSMLDKDQDIIHIDTEGGPTFSDDEVQTFISSKP